MMIDTSPSADDCASTERKPMTTDRQGEVQLLAFWEGGSLSVRLPRHGTFILGRGADADVRISHPTVSRHHAVLVVGSDRITLEDLGSSNGTRIDGTRIEPREVVEVKAGSPLEIGAVHFVVGAGAPVREERPARPRQPAAPKTDMPAVLELVDLVARSTMSVILLGETGVGKEVLATRVHARSPRSGASFVKVNCAALVESLLEAELFGHERGAFTGAVQAKEGLLECADGGTIFLDELGEMPLTTQAKFLRVLECGEVVRVGGVRPRRIDVRVVAATNRNLRELVAAGKFREDLFHRLDGVSVHVPSLRVRRDEIAALAGLFARQTCEASSREDVALSESAIAVLLAYPWPGNIRELRNVIRRSVLLCPNPVIEAEDLRLDALGATPPDGVSVGHSSSSPPPFDPREGERRRIADALEQCVGNQTRAARLLGISRRTLINRLDELAFDRPRRLERAPSR